MKKIRHLPNEDPVKIISSGLRATPAPPGVDEKDFGDTYISGRQMMQLAASMRESNKRNISVFNDLVDEVEFLRWVIKAKLVDGEWDDLIKEYKEQAEEAEVAS